MGKRIEIDNIAPAVIELAGKVAFDILNQGGEGFVTRGSLARALEFQGCPSVDARQLAGYITGSFDIHRRQRTDAPLYPNLAILPIIETTVTVGALSEPSENSNGSRKSLALGNTEVVTLYFNPAVVPEERAKEEYLKAQALRRSLPEKETRPPLCLAIVPFDLDFPAEVLDSKLRKLREAHPEVKSMILRELFYFQQTPTTLIEPESSRGILKQGIITEEIGELVATFRAHIIAQALEAESISTRIAGDMNTAINALAVKNPKKSLAMVLPVQRQLVAPVARILEKSLQNPSLTIQKPHKAFYEPLLRDTLENWNTRYNKPSLEAAFDRLSKENPELAERLLPFIDNPGTLSYEEPNGELDKVLALVIISNEVVFKLLISDLIREIYIGGVKLKGEDKEFVDVALRCLVDQFKSAEEVLAVLVHQDPAFQIDEDQVRAAINDKKTAIDTLKREKAKLGSRSDPTARRRREQGIPSEIRNYEKEEKSLKGKKAEADKSKEEVIPESRIKKALGVKVPARKPRESDYDSQQAFVLDDNAHASSQFLSRTFYKGQ